jgi:hypothetical protein
MHVMTLKWSETPPRGNGLPVIWIRIKVHTDIMECVAATADLTLFAIDLDKVACLNS